jgi:hypothetical protein
MMSMGNNVTRIITHTDRKSFLSKPVNALCLRIVLELSMDGKIEERAIKKLPDGQFATADEVLELVYCFFGINVVKANCFG